MTDRNEDLLDRFPPGFASHRYRATPEEIEQHKRWNKIQREKEELHRKILIEKGILPPDTESDEKKA